MSLSVADGGYDDTLRAAIARAEQRHFWFRTRAGIIGDLARQALAGVTGRARVLEVGCGTGGILRTLGTVLPGAQVVGIDDSAAAMAYARDSAAMVVRADARHPPFALRSFDLVGAFDVIEHIPDDGAALAAFRRLIAPGGRLMLTVPAHQSLWSAFDEASHHCRRYAPDGLQRALEEGGFTVEYLSEFMATTLPLMRLARRRSAKEPATDTARRAQVMRELRIVPLANGALRALLRIERLLIERRHVMPFGSSIVALARVTE